MKVDLLSNRYSLVCLFSHLVKIAQSAASAASVGILVGVGSSGNSSRNSSVVVLRGSAKRVGS